MAKGGMRDKMPVTAALIDDLRSAFGAAYIDNIIKAGMAGQPVFSATENGHTVGTRVPEGTRVVADDAGNRRVLVQANGQRTIFEGDAGRRVKN